MVRGGSPLRPRGIRMRPDSPVLGLAVSVVLLVSACGPKPEIVYIDPRGHDASAPAAYTPIGRSLDPRVHADGAHQRQASVAIDPAAGGALDAPYAPIGSSHDPRVHA